MSLLLLQQHWLSNEQAWLRFQQVGPKSKQGGLSPPGPPHTLTTGGSNFGITLITVLHYRDLPHAIARPIAMGQTRPSMTE